MNEEISVEALIKQLEQLQLEQTKVLALIERARLRESSTPRKENRGLSIGDRVEFRNPGYLQEKTGTVERIGKGRITVKTEKGKIQRERQNLTLKKEEEEEAIHF